ncbi:DNA polymerase epsilon subunit D [Fusarium tjaetaba]|uniref:DNA polymerase epsilon subunit D n=1 Tax=Fusarium tjaetaba TaxID=1567544 RepID=A0A8H5QWU2_9HYPO|nr:DNA polymerase epsilon subunit D [Fusarium tjaetaba]KAF5622043.1 DNA polymerase epsilon subunit D [Fusarium tjaetaba]
MPPRKSSSRKSDTSTARFVPMDDVSPLDQSPAPAPTHDNDSMATQVPTASASASAPAPQAASETAATEAEADTSMNQNGDKKDKDKEKEHKEHITIESIITRLSKGVLPPNTQIQANAIMALSQSTTVFINYLASHANENTVNAGKKTISPADVFKALEETEFAFLKEPLEAEFAKFNAIQTEKRTSYRQKVRAKKSDGPDTDMPDTSNMETDGDTTTVSTGPLAKRPRVEPGNAEAEEDAVTEDEVEIPEDSEDDEVGEEEDEEEGEASGDDTQDALELKEGKEERDEALDGDESD